MPLYPIKSPIRHKNKRKTSGTIELSKADAKPLIDCGALGQAAASSEPPQAQAENKAILAVLKSMQASDPEKKKPMWTARGLPDLKHINLQLKASGTVVTAARRDQLWGKIKE